MHQLVQLAVDAAKQGDKSKALEFIKQALGSNPNDIDAMLLLATMVDESTRKRQVLNRVLSLDATNQAAREMLLELDRAEINAYHQRSPGSSIPKSQPVPETRQASQDPFSKQAYTAFFDKPRVFRYPAGCMAIMYVFTVMSCCGTLWFAVFDWSYSFAFLVLFLAMTLTLGYSLATASSKVETDGQGIRVGSWFRKIEMKWAEIIDLKIDSLRGNLILRSNIGESAKISTNIQGYRTLMEILQEKLPNLYAEAIASQKRPAVLSTGLGSSDSSTYGEKIPAPGPKEQPASPVSTFPPNMQSSTPFPGSPVESAAVAQIHGRTDDQAGKTIVFRYPARGRIGYFVIAAISGFIGVMIAAQGDVNCITPLGIGLLFGLAGLSNQASVKVSETDIRVSNLLSKSEIKWDEIASMKSNAVGKKLELTSNTGDTLKLSTQLEGYPVLVEIVRRKRPDLFSPARSSIAKKSVSGDGYEDSPSMNAGRSAAPVFAGAKTFSKNFFGQYGLFLLMVPLCITGPLLIYLNQDWFAGIAIGLIGLFFMIMSLLSITQIRVEANKLTAEAFLYQKEYTASQIKEISMKTVRSRRGVATNFVAIQPVEGNEISMAGFPDGDEMIYGILVDWWETYKDK